MLRYVEEEVERVKGLFEQKEARLTSERDSAKTAAQQLAREQEELTQTLQKLKHELQHLPGALEVLRALPDTTNRNTDILACCIFQNVWELTQDYTCWHAVCCISICKPYPVFILQPSKLFVTIADCALCIALW